MKKFIPRRAPYEQDDKEAKAWVCRTSPEQLREGVNETGFSGEGAEQDHDLLGAVLGRKSNMPIFKSQTMHLLETTIEKYGTAGETSTESAIRDLLTDLRHFCDQHEIDFDDRLEGSFAVFLEEQENADEIDRH